MAVILAKRYFLIQASHSKCTRSYVETSRLLFWGEQSTEMLMSKKAKSSKLQFEKYVDWNIALVWKTCGIAQE